MALDLPEIARIDAVLGALGADADAAVLCEALGQLLPGLAIRRCDAADVLEDPFRAARGADVHLLDTSGHCIRLTDRPEEATGLLVAERALA